jgi:hypothetical protein
VSTPIVDTAVGAHLVGGLHAPDAETAMTTAVRILGRHLHAVPDGETGDRTQWIFWQIDKLTAIDGIEAVGTHGVADAENSEYSVFPALAIRPHFAGIPRRALGYAQAAEGSYAVFRRLRDDGVVPAGVKFQVCVPTPYASVVAWVREEDQEQFLPVYAAALAAEVVEIAEIVGQDLLLQHDVAVEIGALTGNFPAAPALATEDAVRQSLIDVLDAAPASVEQGVHFCYGDYRHRHFSVPADLSLCVRLANGLDDRAAFVHMPADRETGRDPGYFEPLRDLNATRLSLGVIDYGGDVGRTNEIVAAAVRGSGGREFAVATECGMARIADRGADGPSLEQLLELHARIAAPVR